MQIIPITTPVLKGGNDLAAILKSCAEFRAGDIVVVSSKAVATVEGAMLDLSKYKPKNEALELAAKTGHRSPAFIQAVLEETERLHGYVTGTCPGALLTEVKPDGLPRGTILTANAGLDESNVPEGFAVGWPVEPVGSVKKLRTSLFAPTPQPPSPDQDSHPHPAQHSPSYEPPSPVFSSTLASIPRPLPPNIQPPSPDPFPHEGKGDIFEKFTKDSINRTVLQHARYMRKEPTEAEAILWEELRFDQLGFRFRRQHPVRDQFILDFYCHDARLGIEVDGPIHLRKEKAMLDRDRTEFLKVKGITLLRFTNAQVLHDLPSILHAIKEHLPLNSPPPVGEEPEVGVGTQKGTGVEASDRGNGNWGGGIERQHSLGIILSDSNCRPRRLGVAAFALVCAGVEPLRSEAGKDDLFGKKLRITTEAIADQLATAANFVMGNAGQSIPAAIIRDHGLPPSDFCGWVPGIEPEEDLFRGVI